MIVKDIMTGEVKTVTLDHTIYDVKRIFDNTDIHHVVVVEEGEIYGILSDRDILKCISPYQNTVAETERDLFSLKKKVHQVMTRDPVTVLASSSVKDAAKLILDNKLSCLPVIDENNKLTGMLSWKDILRHVL